MKKLQDVYTKKGFVYTLLERTNEKAIYSQHDENGKLIGHEIFLIQIAKENEAFGTVFPERERYPNDNDFGVTAWSVGRDLDVAMTKYANLEKRIKPIQL